MAYRLLVAACGISFPTRDQTWVPALGAQSRSHWTTREVPSFFDLSLLSTYYMLVLWEALPSGDSQLSGG